LPVLEVQMQACKIDAIAALFHKIIHIRKMQKSYYQMKALNTKVKMLEVILKILAIQSLFQKGSNAYSILKSGIEKSMYKKKTEERSKTRIELLFQGKIH